MERSIIELEIERSKYIEYMRQYEVNGVYRGPELFLALYKKADRELEEAMRQTERNEQ